MDSAEFRQRGKEMVDFIADYLDNIKERRVTPQIEPGYLSNLLSLSPPKSGEKWEDIMNDIEDKIMPGITHWQHPGFHAYFPAGNSYPSILGDMLSSGLGIIGFSWASSPACTELETIVLHWLGKMSGLHRSLLPFVETNEGINMNCLVNKTSTNSILMQSLNEAGEETPTRVEETSTVHSGGGVLLGSASECVLVSMLAARCKSIANYKRNVEMNEDGHILTKLVAYASKLSHSCVEKAAMISLVKIRLLDTDENYSLRGATLENAMKEDVANGLIPFYVCATFGTTGCCSFDNLPEIGAVSKKYNAYLHVDAAYAGNALICKELRKLMPGIELVDSFSSNPNKWLLVNFDTSCLWVKDKYTLTKALSVDPVYLQYRQMDKAIDYRHWGIPLSRRFKSLKLWFTIRSYGVEGLQNYIRGHVRLAKEFEKLLLSDKRFEIFGKVALGLVCFRLKGPDILSKNLLTLLNESGKVQLTPSIVNDKYIIRFCVNAKKADSDDILNSWNVIQSAAEVTIKEPLYSLDRFDSKKFKAFLNEKKSVPQLAKLRRHAFKKMISDPNEPILAAKIKGKLTRASSFVVTDIDIIGETVV